MGRNAAPRLEKQSKTIHLEKWLWELADHLDPCRSMAVKKLFLDHIKTTLLAEGLIQEDQKIGKEHGLLYLTLMKQDKGE